jgi:hypothetical protein
MSLSLRTLVLASFLLAACGGSSAGVDDPTSPSPDPGAGPGSGTGTGDPGSVPGTPGDPGTPGSPPATSGAQITIELAGSVAPFAHADGFAGETPTRQIVAVKSLYLLRAPDDPSPVQVFDLGAAPVEADLVTGATTTIAKVALASLPSGVFTRAKVGVAYVRYSVAARLHSGVTAVDGRYDNEQVLSDGAVLDGVPRDKGWFRYSFAIGATTYGTLEGDDAPTPVATGAGGIVMDMSGPQTFYVFPVALAIDPASKQDRTVRFEANVADSFRWQDQANAGYATGVFDTTPSTFEPVMAFGANAFSLSVK